MEKKLVRDTQNKVFGGVCSGIANYFGIDPTLVRILTVIIAVFTAVFPTFLVYLVFWAVIPADVSVYGQPQPPQNYQTGYQQGYWAGYYQAQAQQQEQDPQFPRTES
ncbi:PspC domain-containing protein [Actinomycetaceae bacterium WB03_NA08]|uniref:PspC domain-containing protein n=1 Tax=Scrofimicrobium canadense TaxID=2652290 RepID=A0A6N7VQW1_9ACTO|nr:PspC domain-containing protein [Scrofimicrobium canadense]MSS84139.1 PspC domain-containing protein [Scrofimicrobium canadense]